MPALTTILSTRDLPEPELHAARLDGELVAVDECFASIDEVDRPWLRARSLAVSFGPRTLVRDSALWVHGAVAVAPAVHHVVQLRVSTLARAGRIVAHEGRVPPCDLVELAGVRVTAAVRTAVDLARHAPGDAAGLRRMLALSRIDPEECLQWLDSAPRMPGNREARALLSRLLPRRGRAQPALTR